MRFNGLLQVLQLPIVELVQILSEAPSLIFKDYLGCVRQVVFLLESECDLGDWRDCYLVLIMASILCEVHQSLCLFLLHQDLDDCIEFVSGHIHLLDDLVTDFEERLLAYVREGIDIEGSVRPRDQIVEQSTQDHFIIEELDPLHYLIPQVQLQSVVFHHIKFLQEISCLVLFISFAGCRWDYFGDALVDGGK